MMETATKKQQLLSVIICLFHLSFNGAEANSNGLTTTTQCLCPGHSVIYECTVTGGIFTVWGGSAFQCAGNEIILSNSEFGSSRRPSAICNNGQITGWGISQENNCYTSQLNVTLSEGLVGTTVTCGVDNGTLQLIGTSVLESTRTPIPPTNISMDVTPNNITFTWGHISRNCPGLYYNIISMNCGTCPNGTAMSNITCLDFQKNGTNCTLMIQSVLCWGTEASITGNATSISLILKVPDAPNLNVTPYYTEAGQLKGFNAIFSKHQISLSDSVGGSPIFFTIVYMGDNCRQPATVYTNSTSCADEICSYYSSEPCSPGPQSGTNITVSATNKLGEGGSSTKTIDQRNNFVMITFHLTSNSKTLHCNFNETSMVSAQRTCEISIASDAHCEGPVKGVETKTTSSNSENTIIINLIGVFSDVDNGKRFCYNVTASNGGQQVVIQDFITPTAENVNNNLAVIIAVPVTIVVTMLFSCVFCCVCACICVYIHCCKVTVDEIERPC